MVRSRKALHESLLKIASVFQRVSLKVQNSDIEKCISMAASEDNFILEIFLNDCFSKTAESFTFLTCDIMLKKNDFWGDFF